MALFHLRHVWSPWERIVMRNNSTGNEYDMQSRTCEVCGLTKRRGFE